MGKDSIELFSWALDLEEPWKVVDVRHCGDNVHKEIHIDVEVPLYSMVRCPCCGKLCKVHDRSAVRTWRDWDVGPIKTFVHARIPRAKCPEHGIKNVEIPWAKPDSRFTLMMESLILALSMEMPAKTVAGMLHISPKKVWSVIRKYAESVRNHFDFTNLRRVGVDERSLGDGKTFITIFVNLDTRKTIFAVEGKNSETLSLFADFVEKHNGSRNKITEFSCDFGAAYIEGIRKHFKHAGITTDRFHLAKMANDCVRDVKCREFRLSVNRLKANCVLTKNAANLSPQERVMLADIKESVRPLGEAHELKESLMMTYNMPDAETAKEHLLNWIATARYSKIGPFVRLSKTVERHITHILRWFISGVSNGILEGINSLINTVKSRARGFKKTQNLIDMVYLVSAQKRLDMYGNPRFD